LTSFTVCGTNTSPDTRLIIMLCVLVWSLSVIYQLEFVSSLYSGFFSVWSFGEKDFICFNVIPVVYSFHLGCKTCLLSKLLCLDNSVQHSIASANRVTRMQLDDYYWPIIHAHVKWKGQCSVCINKVLLC